MSGPPSISHTPSPGRPRAPLPVETPSTAELMVLLDEGGDLAAYIQELRKLLARAQEQAQALDARAQAAKKIAHQAARQLEQTSTADAIAQHKHHVHCIQRDLTAASEKLAQTRSQSIPEAQQRQLAQELHEEILAARALEDRLDDLEKEGRRGLDKAAAQQLPKKTDGVGQDGSAASAGIAADDGQTTELSAAAAAAMDPVAHEASSIVAQALQRSEPPSDKQLRGLQTNFATAMQKDAQAAAFGDPNEMAQWVMRRAYEDNTLDMRRFAMRTQFHTSLRNQVRAEAHRARLFLSDHVRGGQTNAIFDPPFDALQLHKEPQVAEDGSWQVRQPSRAKPIHSQEDLQRYVTDMEQLGMSVGDDMQVTQIELQASMQRQQQLMNALSSVSKALHETAMAILRKIGT